MENALVTQQRMLFNQVKSTPVYEAYTKVENGKNSIESSMGNSKVCY